MDPKEIKNLLKEAKQALRGRDYLTTVKNCKLVLKHDPKTYDAYLLLGAAFTEQEKFQQAVETYKKAIEVDEKNVYAWQGIIRCYDKQGVKVHPDLLDAYKRVATHFEKDDKEKYIESTKKLANLLISQQDTRGALKVLSRLAKSHKIDIDMARMIILLFAPTKFDSRTDDENFLYFSALETLAFEEPQIQDHKLKLFYTQANQMGKWETVMDHAIWIRDRWNAVSAPMEWLCRFYLEGKLHPKQLSEIGSMVTLTDRLFKLHPSSSFGHFARGKFLVDDGLRLGEGIMFLRTGLESRPNNSHAWHSLLKGRMCLGDYEGAVDDCNHAQSILISDKNPNVIALLKEMKFVVAEALSQTDICKAATALTKLREDSNLSAAEDEHKELADRCDFIQCKILAKELKVTEMKPLLEKLAMSPRFSQHWFPVLYSSVEKTGVESPSDLYCTIQAVLATFPGNFDANYEAAEILFRAKCLKESAEVLMEITKSSLGAGRPLPWMLLGQLYSLQDDLQLACKCYRKSYELLPSASAGASLSDAYFDLGEEEKNLELLEEATKSFPKSKSKWAWLRLGILNLHKGKANDAVLAFQATIRSNITDCNVWESLADAYFLRGSYKAALSTYNKAISLGADPMYPKLKIGVVHQCLGNNEESRKTLLSMLKEYPENLAPVFVELARTQCLIASELSDENFDDRARLAAEDAVAYSVLAITHSSQKMLLPWKIIGQCPIILNNVRESTTIRVPKQLLASEPSCQSSVIQDIEQLEYEHISLDKFRHIGIESFLQCLQLVNSSEVQSKYSQEIRSYIYHQLGLLHFYRGRSCQSEELGQDNLETALKCVKKAIALDQQQAMYWNSLGVISYFLKLDDLSQHSFILSLELEQNNVVAWCNLGMLYLKHNDSLMAYKAFSRAQTVSPLYSYSWIGQGLSAELMVDQKLEAPDLFRHAVHLEPTNFAISSYTDWIVKFMLKKLSLTPEDFEFYITRVDALTVVNDSMTRIENRDQSPVLLNMRGIAAALNGFHLTALEAFTKACDLAQNSNIISQEDFRKILMNRIVMLVKLEQYNEAVELFSNIETLDNVGFAVGALAMSKLGYYEQAVNLYEKLLEVHKDSGNDEERNNVILALGLVKNASEGEDAACNVLFKKSMWKNPHALLCLCGIGILNNDAQFVKQVMKHLERFSLDEQFMADVGFMKACYRIMSGDTKGGINVLLRLLHLHPLRGQLWSVLGQIVFRYGLDLVHSVSFRKITLAVLKLSRKKARESDHSIYSKSSAMLSICHLMDNDWRLAKKTALMGVHNFPNERENWVVLACAFWYEYCETKRASCYHTVVKLLMKETKFGRINPRAEEWAELFLCKIPQYKPV